MIQKIHVAHVVYSFGTGGMEKGIATIVRNTSDEFEHSILCLHSSGATERLLPAGTRVLELHKPAGNSPRFLWKLTKTLRTLQPMIVHARNWGSTDAIIAARLAGIRATIQGEHGWLIDDPEGLNPKRLLFRRFLDYWTHEYTCVSQHLEQWLLKTVSVKKPVSQIYNGVDTRKFCPGEEGDAIRAQLALPENTFLVGVVGRLDPIKDHPTLFHAFTDIKKVNPDARLLVVGDGPERPHLESIAGNGIIFLGNRLDIPIILQALDVFILPSLNEGISNTILEAMAAGIPVIATDVGGNPELVADDVAGFLIPPQDASAMAAALLKYSNNPELRTRHGKHGRMRAIQHFSVEKMVASYESVYRRTLIKQQQSGTIQA